MSFKTLPLKIANFSAARANLPASRPILSGSNIPVNSEPGERNMCSKPLPRRTGFRTRL